MRIKEKEAVSPVIGVILMVAITVVLAAVLYVWVMGMAPRGAVTPKATASVVGTPSGDGNFVNISWKIDDPARSDIPWSEVPSASASILLNGVSVDMTAPGNSWVAYETGATNYVKSGDIIRAQLNQTAFNKGINTVILTLVYSPTGGTYVEVSTTVTI